MMRGLVGALEKHHKVRILDEAVAAGVRLSHRYLAGRQLPDKAVSVLDTACARLSLAQNATPPAIEDATRRLDDLEVQKRVLDREVAVGVDHAERLGEIAKQNDRHPGTPVRSPAPAGTRSAISSHESAICERNWKADVPGGEGIHSPRQWQRCRSAQVPLHESAATQSSGVAGVLTVASPDELRQIWPSLKPNSPDFKERRD